MTPAPPPEAEEPKDDERPDHERADCGAMTARKTATMAGASHVRRQVRCWAFDGCVRRRAPAGCATPQLGGSPRPQRLLDPSLELVERQPAVGRVPLELSMTRFRSASDTRRFGAFTVSES